MPVEIVHVPSGKVVNNGDTFPILMTSGCLDNTLSWEAADDPRWKDDGAWVRTFKAWGLSHGALKTRNYTTQRIEDVPYPLDDTEQGWVTEDGEAFTDGSCAWWSYATTSIFKKRKWLAPCIEYQPEYDGYDCDNLQGADLRARYEVLNVMAKRHVRIIKDALDTLPFDTMIQFWGDGVNEENPLYYAEITGYRVYLDMAEAMKYFGTFEKYKQWINVAFNQFVVEEEPF